MARWPVWWVFANAACTILLAAVSLSAWRPVAADTPPNDAAEDFQKIEAGRRIYSEGILPSGELISGIVQGDIKLSGEQVVCGTCHRRSGLGSMEGQEIVPPVVGNILYQPFRLPTSKPPLAPIQRPAYSDETLKVAIRAGVGSGGEVFSPFMPRYALSDEDLDSLIAYLKTLNTDPAPGVSDREIHFATVISDSIDPEIRKALLDVFEAFFEQKNAETRHEGHRARNAPWHKQWQMAPYRKWVLHVWELTGPPESWPAQLRAQYDEQPVFALLNGVAAGSWQPVHQFCEQNRVPCLFPTTDLPVSDQGSFYSVYLSEGMTLEAGAVTRHLADDGLIATPVVQIFRSGDPRGEAAAQKLRSDLTQLGGLVTDIRIADGAALTNDAWSLVLDESGKGIAVFWLERPDLEGFWKLDANDGKGRIYLSTSLFGVDPTEIPESERERVYLVHPYELPSKLPRLLARSTGWLKSRRIYAPDAQRVQGNAYLTLKVALGALKGIGGFFVRDYFLERIEHTMDRATYTSVYPRVSLAPGQRFVSRGAYIAQFKADGSGGLVAVTDWLVPASYSGPDSSKTDLQPRQ